MQARFDVQDLFHVSTPKQPFSTILKRTRRDAQLQKAAVRDSARRARRRISEARSFVAYIGKRRIEAGADAEGCGEGVSWHRTPSPTEYAREAVPTLFGALHWSPKIFLGFADTQFHD